MRGKSAKADKSSAKLESNVVADDNNSVHSKAAAADNDNNDNDNAADDNNVKESASVKSSSRSRSLSSEKDIDKMSVVGGGGSEVHSNSNSNSNSIHNDDSSHINSSSFQENCDSSNSCIDISQHELEQFSVETTTITPAGKALVLVKNFKSSNESWLSVHDKGYLFGLRYLKKVESQPMKQSSNSSQSSFVCHAENNTRFVITTLDVGEDKSRTLKPDKKGIVCVSASFENGLTISMGSNGAIRIFSSICGRLSNFDPLENLDSFYTKSSKKKKIIDPNFIGDEKTRCVLSGNITRTLANGPFLTDKFLPDGTRVLTRKVETPASQQPQPSSLNHTKATKSSPSKNKNSKPISPHKQEKISPKSSEKYPFLSKFLSELLDLELSKPWATLKLLM